MQKSRQPSYSRRFSHPSIVRHRQLGCVPAEFQPTTLYLHVCPHTVRVGIGDSDILRTAGPAL